MTGLTVLFCFFFLLLLFDISVTSGDWKCYTIFYGPNDGGDCFGDCYGDDCGPDPDRFIPPNCKYGQLNGTGANCTGTYYSYDSDWYTTDYDDSDWDNATEYDDDVVGWGVSPSNYYLNVYNTSVIDPLWLNWSDSGSTFIWQSSLDFDNRILCRYSYEGL